MIKNLDTIAKGWKEVLNLAISKIPTNYLNFLEQNSNWLPGKKSWLNAFSIPPEQVQFVLYGESPYPRAGSANGYAFWDNAVNEIWSENGFSKQVNRATSLRNFLKMLLKAEEKVQDSENSCTNPLLLKPATLHRVSTLKEVFINLLNHGFLLLNANLALTSLGKSKDYQAFLNFQREILKFLSLKNPKIKLILLGKFSEKIGELEEAKPFDKIVAEHPYNLSFINNNEMIDFFKTFNLLEKKY